MSLVSIIVPIYKVEKYLIECIESIRKQTYKDLEIILVEDGSPDNCPQICDKYKKKDNRIIVIHQKNGGLSSARNSGIKRASGEYIMFVDSDDVIHSCMIEKMLYIMNKFDADISICNKTIDFQVWSNVDVNTKLSTEIMSGKESCEKMYENKYQTLITSCGKLFKKSIIENIWFPEDKIHEDNFTSYKFFLKSKKIILIDFPFYFYRQRQDSIMHYNFSKKNFDRYEAYEQQEMDFYKLDMQRALKKTMASYAYIIISDWKKTNDKKLHCYMANKYKKLLKRMNNSNLFNRNEMLWFNAPHFNKFLLNIYWKKVAIMKKINLIFKGVDY